MCCQIVSGELVLGVMKFYVYTDDGNEDGASQGYSLEEAKTIAKNFVTNNGGWAQVLEVGSGNYICGFPLLDA